jgi:hypothetical protein
LRISAPQRERERERERKGKKERKEEREKGRNRRKETITQQDFCKFIAAYSSSIVANQIRDDEMADT